MTSQLLAMREWWMALTGTMLLAVRALICISKVPPVMARSHDYPHPVAAPAIILILKPPC